MEPQQGRGFIDAAVVANVVASGAIYSGVAGGDSAFQDDLRFSGHLEIHGLALGQVEPFARVQSGKQPFGQVNGQRGSGRQNHQGMHADRDRHLEVFAHLSGFAQVAATAPHRQPLHRGRIL